MGRELKGGCLTATAGVSLVLLGCMAPEPRAVWVAEQLLVDNGSPAGDVDILVKACGASSSAYRPLGGGRVRASTTGAFPMHPGCVDLAAIAADGRVVGRQAGVEMVPGMMWTLR